MAVGTAEERAEARDVGVEGRRFRHPGFAISLGFVTFVAGIMIVAEDWGYSSDTRQSVAIAVSSIGGALFGAGMASPGQPHLRRRPVNRERSEGRTGRGFVVGAALGALGNDAMTQRPYVDAELFHLNGMMLAAVVVALLAQRRAGRFLTTRPLRKWEQSDVTLGSSHFVAVVVGLVGVVAVMVFAARLWPAEPTPPFADPFDPSFETAFAEIGMPVLEVYDIDIDRIGLTRDFLFEAPQCDATELECVITALEGAPWLEDIPDRNSGQSQQRQSIYFLVGTPQGTCSGYFFSGSEPRSSFDRFSSKAKDLARPWFGSLQCGLRQDPVPGSSG